MAAETKPAENRKDIPEGHLGLAIHPVETAEEAFRLLFADGGQEEKKEGHDDGNG